MCSLVMSLCLRDLHMTSLNNMLNKNNLAVKKVRGQSKATMVSYKQPKTLISSKAKKLNILLRILLLE